MSEGAMDLGIMAAVVGEERVVVFIRDAGFLESIVIEGDMRWLK